MLKIFSHVASVCVAVPFIVQRTRNYNIKQNLRHNLEHKKKHGTMESVVQASLNTIRQYVPTITVSPCSSPFCYTERPQTSSSPLLRFSQVYSVTPHSTLTFFSCQMACTLVKSFLPFFPKEPQLHCWTILKSQFLPCHPLSLVMHHCVPPQHLYSFNFTIIFQNISIPPYFPNAHKL